MRKRSGGLHCDTQQQFIQLAELSQQKCGLYYDDQLNRKKSQLKNSKPKAQKPQKTPPIPLKANIFMDFDYNEEDIYQKQYKNQLNKSFQAHEQTSITIICSEPQRERIKLQNIIESITQTNQAFKFPSNFDRLLHQTQNANTKVPLEQNKRIMDLYIYKSSNQQEGVNSMLKFWFIRINSFNSEICSTYLNLTDNIFRLRQQSLEIDLQEYLSDKGKRHAIRDVDDLQEVANIFLKDKFPQQDPQDFQFGFNRQYMENEEFSFQLDGSYSSFERKS